MIKLVVVPQPDELTLAVTKSLTDSYKQTKKPVWQQPYIKEALLKVSNSKCCYCECEINVAGSDLHVEHFHPASIYKDEVVEWSNLLPACVRCNRKKGTLDTKIKPIIHPIRNNPKEHIKISNFYFYDKDELGEFTIERLDLNDADRLAVDRYKLGLAIINQLNKLTKEITEVLATELTLTDRQQIKFTREIKSIMQLGTAEKKYSAVISTVIITDSNYTKIKQLFEANNLWNNDFYELEQQVTYCALI